LKGSKQWWNNPQFAVQAQELCKERYGFAKGHQEVVLIYPDMKPIDATSCVILCKFLFFSSYWLETVILVQID